MKNYRPILPLTVFYKNT